MTLNLFINVIRIVVVKAFYSSECVSFLKHTIAYIIQTQTNQSNQNHKYKVNTGKFGPTREYSLGK